MLIAKDISELRRWRAKQKSVGFVPTMGALHEGHLSLVERAKAENEAVVVSIFVNPLQFGPTEDLDAYPRQLAEDSAKLQAAGVDLLYVPAPEVMYPDGFKTTIHVEELGDRLCGAVRPGHFDGVCTVVAKLFNQVMPDRAYFGEKDYQQLSIVNKMVDNLNLSLEVIGVPTHRHEDGLARSSRNAYLSPEERAIAPQLHAILRKCAEDIVKSVSLAEVLKQGTADLLKAGFSSVDYLEYCDPVTLKPLSEYQSGARLLAAARLGKARLIDNIAVE